MRAVQIFLCMVFQTFCKVSIHSCVTRGGEVNVAQGKHHCFREGTKTNSTVCVPTNITWPICFLNQIKIPRKDQFWRGQWKQCWRCTRRSASEFIGNSKSRARIDSCTFTGTLQHFRHTHAHTKHHLECSDWGPGHLDN